MNNTNKLINRNIYNTSQPLSEFNSSENYYYNRNSNKNDNSFDINNSHLQNNYRHNTDNDEYLSNHVNNSNNNNKNSHINNSSFRSRYSSPPPYSSSISSYSSSRNSLFYNNKSYPKTTNDFSSRDQQLRSLPSPNSLLPTDKNEYKNVYVKVKSKRMNERFNSFIDYSVYDTSNLKYSREEVDQLKKELDTEFNGTNTLDEFKKLNQNEQKKLIIQICRFLMRRAGIKSENSIPWKQLAMNNASFTFVNWPLSLPNQPIEPGYPTKLENQFESVPYEDLSRLKTSHRKTLFMALRSGAVYAIKIQKKKKTDLLKNNNNTNNNNHNNTINHNHFNHNDIKSHDSIPDINYLSRKRDREIIEKRRNMISLEKRDSPSFIPINENIKSYFNDHLGNSNNNNNHRNSYEYHHYPNSSKDFDYDNKPINEKDYQFNNRKPDIYDEKNYKSINNNPYNDDFNYSQNLSYRKNSDYLLDSSNWKNRQADFNNLNKKESSDYWKYNRKGNDDFNDSRKEEDNRKYTNYHSKDNDYIRKGEDDYRNNRSNNDYDLERPYPKSMNRQNFNNMMKDEKIKFPKPPLKPDFNSFDNFEKYYKTLSPSLNNSYPSYNNNKKRSLNTIYPEDLDEYCISMNNANKIVKSNNSTPIIPMSLMSNSLNPMKYSVNNSNNYNDNNNNNNSNNDNINNSNNNNNSDTNNNNINNTNSNSTINNNYSSRFPYSDYNNKLKNNNYYINDDDDDIIINKKNNNNNLDKKILDVFPTPNSNYDSNNNTSSNGSKSNQSKTSFNYSTFPNESKETSYNSTNAINTNKSNSTINMSYPSTNLNQKMTYQNRSPYDNINNKDRSSYDKIINKDRPPYDNNKEILPYDNNKGRSPYNNNDKERLSYNNNEERPPYDNKDRLPYDNNNNYNKNINDTNNINDNNDRMNINMSSLNYNYKQKLPYISSKLPPPIQSPYSHSDHSSINSNSMKIDNLKLGIDGREVEGRRNNEERYSKPDINLNFIPSLDNYNKPDHLPMNPLNKLSNSENLPNDINIIREIDGVNTQINQKLQKLVEELTTKNMVLKEELDKIKSSINNDN